MHVVGQMQGAVAERAGTIGWCSWDRRCRAALVGHDLDGRETLRRPGNDS